MALERRTPTGSESPSAARMSAIRLTVAKNHTTSPDVAFAINVFKPSSESQAHTSRAFRARSSRSLANSGSASRIAAVRIVWNRDQVIIPREPADRRIEFDARIPGQASGLLRDLAGLPGPHLTGLHLMPQHRQPIPQIQRVSDQRAGGHRTRALQRARAR